MEWFKTMLKWFTKKTDVKKIVEVDDESHPRGDTDLELTHVDRFEIIAPIGQGGMGTVFKAIDRARDQTVAIKVLDRRYDLDKKRRKRDYLGREILLVGDLEHPNIIKMSKDIIEQEDTSGHIRRCLLMEYIDGGDLRQLIETRRLPFKQMLDICIQLAHGLDFLHQKGIIHRDIKPGNFLFSRDLRLVKVVDFGLSKSNSSWRTRWFAEKGGTRAYMSPEQLAKKPLDERSDIFSFGITMYQFFSGHHPCTGKGDEIQRQLRSKNYKFEPPSKYNKDIPPQLDRIILKALRRSPDHRYQSVTEMLMDLTRIVESRI